MFNKYRKAVVAVLGGAGLILAEVFGVGAGQEAVQEAAGAAVRDLDVLVDSVIALATALGVWAVPNGE